MTILWTCSSGDHVGRREKAQFRATHPPGKKHHQARSGPQRPQACGDGRLDAHTQPGPRARQTDGVCTRRLSVPPAPGPFSLGHSAPPAQAQGLPRHQTMGATTDSPPLPHGPSVGPVASSARLGGSPARGRAWLPPPNPPTSHSRSRRSGHAHTHSPDKTHTYSMQARRCAQGMYTRARGTG